jgi:hypothetical protein
MRWFILVTALLLDPAAVLLLLAATHGGRRQRPEARSSIVLDLNPRMLLQKCND